MKIPKLGEFVRFWHDEKIKEGHIRELWYTTFDAYLHYTIRTEGGDVKVHASHIVGFGGNMDGKEALAALIIDRKRIKRFSGWRRDSYIEINDKGQLVDENGNKFAITDFCWGKDSWALWQGGEGPYKLDQLFDKLGPGKYATSPSCPHEKFVLGSVGQLCYLTGRGEIRERPITKDTLTANFFIQKDGDK